LLRIREEYEKDLTKGELMLFDKKNNELYEINTIKTIILGQIESEIAECKTLFSQKRTFEA
jgi:hypothetical protein